MNPDPRASSMSKNLNGSSSLATAKQQMPLTFVIKAGVSQDWYIVNL